MSITNSIDRVESVITDEVPNMHIALTETLTPGINPEGENQCKQFQYCLYWA